MAGRWQTRFEFCRGARRSAADVGLCAVASAITLLVAGQDPQPAVAAPLSAPTGPYIREIRLERNPVFSDSEREAVHWLPLGLINRLHVNTRSSVIRRELVTAPGEVYDPLAVSESERKLRALRIFRRVEIRSEPAPGDSVDLVIRTQELWTTAIDVRYEKFEEQRVWNAQIRERNLFGTARTLELQRAEDADRSSWTVGFLDPQLLGTRWYGALRVTDADDGGAWAATLARPFFRLDDEWSWIASVSDRVSSPRYYVDDARFVRPDGEFTDMRFAVGKRLGSTPIGVWRGSLGYALSAQELSATAPLPLNNASGELEAEFDFPERANENRSLRTVYAGFERRARTYEKLRFINAMGSVEDIPIGPEFEARLGWTTRVFGGSDSGLYLYGATNWFSWWSPDWLSRAHARIEGVVDEEGGQDLRLITSLTGYHTLKPGLSLAVGTLFAAAERIDRHQVFGLGLDSGLRAARFRELNGDRLWRANAELRTIYTPGLWGLLTPGIAIFSDVGTAWFEDHENFRLDLVRGAVGFGLRLGLDRAANDVPIRVDLAWPILYPATQPSPVLSVGTGHVF